MSKQRLLKIILGPTAVGKTSRSITLAKQYDSPVISCDSRQMYREMFIGTAAPTQEQMQGVTHYFIRDRSIELNGAGDGQGGAGDGDNKVDGRPDVATNGADDKTVSRGKADTNDGHGSATDGGIYTAGKYELEAVALIERLFDEGHEVLIMCGGSPFYIDAVCNGLDDFPASDMNLRAELMGRLANEGLSALVEQLHSLDPESWTSLEMSNPQRVVRALEVCLMTGRPFSSFKTAPHKQRNFTIEKIGLMRPREELYARIDERTVGMFRDGLIEEAAGLYDKRNLPALQTVGYKEIFDMLDGQYDQQTALELIQRNTRRYAKRQLSWWRRDDTITWLEA